MKKNWSFILVLFYLTMFSLVSCRPLANETIEKTPSINKHFFRLVILDPEIVFKLGSGSTYYETLWPRLEQSYLSARVHTINEDDITNYDWKMQRITLTPEASSTILKIFNCSTDEDKLYYPLCLALPNYLFVVAPDDIPLYGGVFTQAMSTLGRTYPVIYPTFVIDDNQKMKMVFTILSGHPARKSSTSAWATPGWDVMKDERIKTIFSDLGKLTE